jgi:acyl carrier protein
MYERILEIIDSIRLDKFTPLSPGTQLIGSDRILDSLLLVELCLKLEDLGSELNFNFDWTSTEAMSRSASMFRDIQSLVAEFENQLSNSK